MAKNYLARISMSEQLYREEYETFGTLRDLARFEPSKEFVKELLRDGFPCAFALSADGGTFTAIARHKTRPHTRRTSIVGPDGAVKALSDDASDR